MSATIYVIVVLLRLFHSAVAIRMPSKIDLI